MDGEPLTDVVKKDIRMGHLHEMGLAIIGGSVVLGGLAFGTMYFMPERPAPVAEETHTPAPDAFAGVHISAESAVVYDLSTGETLYGKSPEAQLPLASLTKLLTIYAAADSMPLDAPIAIDATALAEEGDSGFTEGETFAFRDLAQAALVASSNDAASAIARTSSGRRALAGPDLLASAASAAGLSQTYALNGTGLDESATISGAYGSALDVAALAGALLKKIPAVARASAEASVTIASTNGVMHEFENTNPDVARIPGLLLSKTGYTDLAGGNLVIVFDAGMNHPVALVVLGSTREERVTDVAKLLDATLTHFSYAS